VKRLSLILSIALLACFLAGSALAQDQTLRLPSISLGVEEATSPEQVSTALQIVILLTVLALAPSILIMTTSFTRLAVVFSLLRNAMGTQQQPPAQIVVGLSLFLTIFIMTPVFNQIDEKALTPFMEGAINQQTFFAEATKPMKDFMMKHTRQKDLGLFMKIAGQERPRTPDDVPLTSLIPAFVISELSTAFQIGFMLYIPFLVIDMVIASVLLSMGMMMLPPVMVSLPFKLMLFVLVDGWYLIVGSMVQSFN
jgi:flagellar biosynthetic protein FliP